MADTIWPEGVALPYLRTDMRCTCSRESVFLAAFREGWLGALRDRIAQRCHEQGLRLADGALATTETLTRLLVRRISDAVGP